MKILVTGANGFIGKNLCLRLRELKCFEIIPFTREQSFAELSALLPTVNCVFHLAGVNRSDNEIDFQTGNADLTERICHEVRKSSRNIPIVYTSSIQATQTNSYGLSKLKAEEALLDLHRINGASIHIFRLTNVFGKWARPNYNSVVATFCHNIARDLPIRIDDPNAEITIVYIDDVVNAFLECLNVHNNGILFPSVQPEYKVTVGSLAKVFTTFKKGRETLVSEQVGEGLYRKLYSTYVSYLPSDRFSYQIPKHSDKRGVFVEMLKTKDSGQFSYFTAHPGVSRGGHYHHTKTEKFLVVKGRARFTFRHIITNDYFELSTSDEIPEIVETVPGWAHEVTNIGDQEMIVMIWANEIFQKEQPDTVAYSVSPEI